MFVTTSLFAVFTVPLVGAVPAHADTSTTTYSSPGEYSYVTPPGTVAVEVTVAGSAGTPATPLSGVPGAGTELTGSFPIAAGAALDVWVGEGVDNEADAGGDGAPNGTTIGGHGGGASLITGWIIAAGGGGPGSGSGGVAGGNGGNGGGFCPGNAVPAGPCAGSSGTPVTCAGGAGAGGAGATDAAGGAGGPAGCGGFAGFAGTFGRGGGGDSGVLGDGGGGGGGYYGGGGGAGGSVAGGGGGGGSSWAATTVVSPVVAGFNNAPAGFVMITPIGADGLPPGPIVPPLGPIVPPSNGASASCQARGGTVLFDTTNEGVRAFAYDLEPNPQELDVCVRVDDNGTGVGGMFAVTPTVPIVSITGIGTPTIVPPTFGVPSVDENSPFCTTQPAGVPPNKVPGAHPISTGILPGGATWSIDAYTDLTSTVRICVHAASVDEQVIIPISPPVITPPTVGTPSVGVTPGTDVTFTPDTGTP